MSARRTKSDDSYKSAGRAGVCAFRRIPLPARFPRVAFIRAWNIGRPTGKL